MLNTDMKYNFRCTECLHDWEVETEKHLLFDEYEKPCPSCAKLNCIEKWIPNPNGNPIPARGDGVRMGTIKPDKGFQEVLHKIHEKTPGSTLNRTRYF